MGLFLNSYMMCGGNPYFFYGARVCDLTSYQTIIGSHGNSCKNILENADNTMPDYDDIDDICDWFRREADIINKKYTPKKKQNASPSDNSSKKQRLEGVGIVGASKEEVAQIAQKEGSTPINFIEAAEKLKKQLGKDTLDTKDLVKIHD